MGDFRAKAAMRLHIGLALLPLLASSGCISSMKAIPTLPGAPTVPQLQAHMTCVIARAMDRHLGPAASRTSEDYALWNNLVKYNVLDTVNLTLFVTQTQGLNPSLNFITPLTNLGGPIQTVFESSNGTAPVSNATDNRFNFTLAVGFQLQGTQDRNFVLNYVMDLHKLYDAMYVERDGRPDYIADGLLKHCDDLDAAKSATGLPYGLKGDLALEETIATGLQTMQAAPFSPMTAGTKAGQGSTTASVAQSGGSTAFSSKIDFSLQWGVSGGPNWNILRFKGPSSGQNALLNFSRNKQDTLISTFAATCKTDDLLNLMDPRLYSETTAALASSTGKPDAFEIAVREASSAGSASPRSRRFLFTVATPEDKSGLSFNSIGSASGALSIATVRSDGTWAPNADGTIGWTGFLTRNQTSTSYSLRGLLADAQSGTAVGYIYAGIVRGSDGKVKLTNLKVSKNAISFIAGEGEPGPNNFWASLPSCGNAGPFLPNGLNLLQQLPGGVTSTLEQQR